MLRGFSETILPTNNKEVGNCNKTDGPGCEEVILQWSLLNFCSSILGQRD